MIRVLIVEDSITQREIFRRLLADDDQLRIVAEAKNGDEALLMVAAHRPDVVLMDIHMPGMDGITATREIMKICPVPIVVASATLRKREVNLALEAYRAGAVSVIEKPDGAVLLHLSKMGPTLRNELIAASKAKLGPPPRVALKREDRLPSASQSRFSGIQAVGVCASTGGPPVLLEIFSAIPKPYPLPILLVQHISQGFEEGFTRWLSDITGQRAAIATSGQRVEPGIWMAPAGSHLTWTSDRRIGFTPGVPSDIHCPSGNAMFESLATHLGPGAAGVVLTGMGDDGAAGLLALRLAGGTTMVQDEASSVIWGMPKAARDRGAADQVLTPTEIAHTLEHIATSAISVRGTALKT